MTVKVFRLEGRYVFDLRGYLLYTLFKWSVNPDGYLYRKQNGKNKLFHRQIIAAKDKEVIDHANRDVRDNRPENLRSVTKSFNAINCGPKGSGPYKGIKPRVGKNGVVRYQARIRAGGVDHVLGTFGTPEEAAKAYNDAVKEFFETCAEVWTNPV